MKGRCYQVKVEICTYALMESQLSCLTRGIERETRTACKITVYKALSELCGLPGELGSIGTCMPDKSGSHQIRAL